MRKATVFKLALALLVFVFLYEIVEATGIPKEIEEQIEAMKAKQAAAASRKTTRKRMVHEPYDPNNVDPDDPYDESEERPPVNPGQLRGSATPKMVKGIKLEGENGVKDFQAMTERLKMQGENMEYDVETAMARAHRHNKVLEKLRRQKIAAKKARKQNP